MASATTTPPRAGALSARSLLRRAPIVAILVAVALCVAGVFQHELWTPDEPREAEVAREMLDAGFAATPTLGGLPFLEKPPLFAWTVAGSYAAFGVSAEAARIPSTLFAIGAIVVAYLLGRRAGGRLAGAAAAIVLATMWQFAETSHKSVLDIALTFFVAAGHLAFLEAGRRRGTLPYLAIAVCAGLAFLTKAWIGPGLMCAPPIVAWAVMRDRERVRRVLPRAFVAATLGVAALGLPWAMALAKEHGWAAVKECLVTEYVGRSVGGAEFAKKGHDNPVWYYLTVLPHVTAPWILALPAMLKARTLARRPRALWCALLVATSVVLLSLPSGKRDLYLLPLLPALAAAFGAWLARTGTARRCAWDVVTCRGIAALAWVVVVAVGVGAAFFRDRIGEIPRDAVLAFARGCVAVGLVSLGGAILVRRVLRIVPSSGFRMAWALCVLFGFLHAAVRPLLDPLRDMSAGARAIAAAVPRDEALVAVHADETTLAVVPFYSGRILENVDGKDAEEITARTSARVAAGDVRHLVLEEKDLRKLGPDLRRRLALAQTVRLSATREINVYALKP